AEDSFLLCRVVSYKYSGQLSSLAIISPNRAAKNQSPSGHPALPGRRFAFAQLAFQQRKW
ncbi:MAG: hypothetical protein AB1Z18_01300, partial [Desulfobacterales bacterium]